jgi:hypothetical protein
MASFVLVHSPLVGPTTWRWVADELEERGHRVVIPVVTESVTSKGWEAFVESVADQSGDLVGKVVVGHSGAGPLLPKIVEQTCQQPGLFVFVDPGIPPETGDAELMPSEFLEELRAMAHDGILPRWSEWFGPGAIDELIPDHKRRAAVCSELPQLPVAYFESRVPVPDGWSGAGGGYLLLSQPYATDAGEAASRGWPVIRLPGSHLDIVTRPAAIADATLSLAGGLAP